METVTVRFTVLFMPGFRPEDKKQDTTEIKETLVRLLPRNVPLSDANANLLARDHYTVVQRRGERSCSAYTHYTRGVMGSLPFSWKTCRKERWKPYG